MTLAFRKKLVKVRYLGSSQGGVDRVINYADVVEVSELEARQWIAAGLAEETSDPVGPGPTLNPGRQNVLAVRRQQAAFFRRTVHVLPLPDMNPKETGAMAPYSERLADLYAELDAMLAKAKAEGRKYFAPADDQHFEDVYNQILEIKGKTPMAPTTATMSGRGFRVLDYPHFPHVDVQRLAEEIWRRAIRWGPWPDGWSVKFGELFDEHARNGAAIFYGRKLIVVDEAKLRRCEHLEEDLRESLLHEICHLIRGPEADHHDPRFYQTLEELKARVPKVIATWTRVRR
jgi:hypothetical protein